MRVLAIIHDRLWPMLNAQRVRNFNLWPLVQAAGVDLRVVSVDLCSHLGPAAGPPGLRVDYLPLRRRSLPVRAVKVLLKTHHEQTRTPAIAAAIDDIIAGWKPDVVHAEELRNGYFLPAVRRKSCPALQTVTLHNVESQLYAQIGRPTFAFAASHFAPIQQRSLESYERRVVTRAHLAFAYSPRDMEIYRGLYPDARWAATRNGSDTRSIVPRPQVIEPRVAFIGSLDYAPNIAGLFWYLDHIRPHLPPGVRLTVAGSNAHPSVRARLKAEPEIEFIDSPLDLADIYARVGLSVVPILDGSGTRGKILESLGHERFVVSTTKGAEGLLLDEGEGITIADDPRLFADRVAHWLRHHEERGRLARAGRAAVVERYDWSLAARELIDAWERRLADHPPSLADGAPLDAVSSAPTPSVPKR